MFTEPHTLFIVAVLLIQSLTIGALAAVAAIVMIPFLIITVIKKTLRKRRNRARQQLIFAKNFARAGFTRSSSRVD